MNNENIKWEENPSIEFKFPTQKTQQTEKKIIEEKEYSSLYEELKEKLNPENYMGDNYDAEKLEICNELYSQLLKKEQQRTTEEYYLKSLRNTAIDKLQLHFSAQKLYKELSEYCDPKQFMNPYNEERIKIANTCYKIVQDNKDNILGLESLSSSEYYKHLTKEKEQAFNETKERIEREAKEEAIRKEIERVNAIKEFKINKLIDKKVRFYSFLYNCAFFIFWLLTFALFSAVIFVLIYQWNNDQGFCMNLTKECLFGLLYIGLYAGIIALLWQIIKKLAMWYLQKREQAEIEIDMTVLNNMKVEELSYAQIKKNARDPFELIIKYLIAIICNIIIGGALFSIVPFSVGIWQDNDSDLALRIVAQIILILSYLSIAGSTTSISPFLGGGVTKFFDEWERENYERNRFRIIN